MNKLKNFIINFGLDVVALVKKIFKTDISRLRFETVTALLIKTVLFMTLVKVSDAVTLKFININIKYAFIYAAFILLFYSFGYLLSKNKQIVFLIGYNALYSAMLIVDLWYYRVNRDVYGLKNILYPGTFNVMKGSLINFNIIDVVFIIDIVLVVLWIAIKKVNNNEERSKRKFSFTFRYSIIVILLSYVALDIIGLGEWCDKITKSGWYYEMTANAPGPMGYHIVEAGKTLGKKVKASSERNDEAINEWISNNNENLEDNEYSGILKGKNVIFLQIESLENFVINKTANGQEITPFLNKLTKEGLYFSNFYEQNNAGNSIDCDFLVNTSVFPLGDEITALNYGVNTYSNSLPKILESEGYTTISTHAEEPGEFNWSEIHRNSFDSETLWSIRDYKYEETVGYGLSDKSFLRQIAEKVENEDKPFFIQAPTLSSHGPFNIDKKYRELNLPKEIDENYLGGYFESVHYTDKQIEMFFNMLQEEGLLDNTVVVIYGDHTGVHKYYNDSIQELSYEGDWWKEVDHKIPLIIYSKDMPNKEITAHGGQVDLIPTVSYLLGVDKEKYINTSMGRNLVNTNRDATAIKGNEIVGNVSSEEEKEHLLNAYGIGSQIIKKDYFSK
ncbi:Phosphoglycerol transferase MdoB [Clostridium sp. DSM 8431]|uniref:LTA synthase family protein n=1 Tax=Clostridium sp. DSM 8431 TaxID=1761781 RepID=UPI0008EB0ECD|nr:LTA synthase family protein [Clostridium sp. DSM 8431]SFU56520.1 Phosphoglycerol transferase MdoB [Clostridium sp. DSM 8431]